MDDIKEFEKETEGRLARIETKVDMLVENCTPCRIKMSTVNDMAHEALLSAKSAHHRLDEMENARKELKQDLESVIDDKIGSIHRTVIIVSGLTGTFISIVGILLQHFWR